MTSPALDYERPSTAAAPTVASATPSIAVTIVRCVATLGIAVWLGSLVHLLLTVASLFAAFPKATSSVAVQGAPAIFAASERVGLVIAAITLAAAVAWTRFSPGRS